MILSKSQTIQQKEEKEEAEKRQQQNQKQLNRLRNAMAKKYKRNKHRGKD